MKYENNISSDKRKEYEIIAKEYFNKHFYRIVTNIRTIGELKNILLTSLIGTVFDENFPKIELYEKDDYTNQVISFIETIGFRFNINTNTNIICIYDDMKLYKESVKEHIALNGINIINSVSECCEKHGSKIPYWEINKMMEGKYIKPPFIKPNNSRLCCLFYLLETKLVLRFDEEWIYFY